MKISRFGHTAVRARDALKTARFYQEMFDAEEAFRMHREDGSVGTVYLRFPCSAFLEIFNGGTEEVPLGGSSIAYCHICLEVEDIEAAYADAREKGLPIDVPLKTGTSGCLLFFTHDPDGNAIEVMETPPESLQAKARK